MSCIVRLHVAKPLLMTEWMPQGFTMTTIFGLQIGGTTSVRSLAHCAGNGEGGDERGRRR